ncbi:DNA-binding transcriptional activator BglJ [Enterobacter cloacae]|uniref:DNA-binding transcriptional activator BglJ n=1 Tax=Enterobacter cloacae TaxID=550 RepID=A0A377M8R6_ENTCL|nr:DNA-binding transcriptional activator BglJ [Enterobacter cloacae]
MRVKSVVTAWLPCGISLFTHSDIQRIVLASDDMEARLISHLSPSRLHGIVSKSVPLSHLQEELVVLLRETHHINDNMLNHWYVNQNRLFKPNRAGDIAVYVFRVFHS